MWALKTSQLWRGSIYLGRTFIISTLLILFVAVEAQGAKTQTTRRRSFSLTTQQGDRLFIKGFSGKLTLIGKPHVQTVSLWATRVNPQQMTSLSAKKDWGLSFRRVGRQIEIVVKGPSSKLGWNFAQNSKRPRFEIFVEAPPMPAEIHWQEAGVQIRGWRADLVVSVEKGRVDDSKGRGLHKISLQNGQLKVGSHEGELELESYKGKIDVFNSRARVNFENFAGVSQVEKVSGEIHFISYKGLTKLVQCEGRVEFKNIQSLVKIEKFKGVIRGQSKQGVIRVSSVGRADIRVKSEEGGIYLNLSQSGAKVNLGSVEGSIYAPKFLRLTRLPNFKTIRGQLRGRQPGDVYARTDSGPIYLR